MSRTARTRVATVLTVALLVALSGLGLMVRGSGGTPVAQQPVAQVTTSSADSNAAVAATAAPAPADLAPVYADAEGDLGEEAEDG